MLLKAIKTQVETRLESSLHNRIYIIPSQDKNLNQVEHPWSIDVKSGSKPKVRLSPNTHIITVFDQAGIDGRLLILGQPGAGKTTMLLELAKKLVERAENDLNEPVPILLSLTSWQNDHQSTKDWIVTELNSGKYYKVRKDITKQWLEDGKIIPLLDGLDELPTSQQESCVQKLNEFLLPGNWSYPLVVCSRIEEYQLYSTQLALNTSVELQPFTPEQIQEYLTRTGNYQLGDSLRDDSTLRELAQTPLLLNILVISCQNISLDKWQKLESSAERLNYLFSAYVEVMLGRRYEEKQPNSEKTKYWLSWLAGKLIKQNQTEFFIEKMQPSWLENRRQKRIYSLIVGLSVVLSYGLIFGLNQGLNDGLNQGLNDGLNDGLSVGLSVGLIFGLIGLIFGLIGEIRASKVLLFNWKNFWRERLSYELSVGLIVGLIVGLSFGLIHWQSEGLSVGLSVGLIVGLIGLIFGLIGEIRASEVLLFNWKNFWREGLSFGLIGGLSVGLMGGLMGGLIGGLIQGLSFGLSFGLIVGLVVGFNSSEIETRTSPNQGIWKSLQNAVIVGLSFGLIVGLSVGLIQGLIVGLIQGLIVGLIVGLIQGLIQGLTTGKACIQHFVLRLILYCNGHIPWNYARFLDYATDRLFLQRVGGGYRFMHDLLRQHFAQNYR